MAKLARLFGRFVHRHAPSRDEVLESRWLKPFGKRVRASEYWRFTRRSVPRGVAIGLFVGIFLMVPGLQIVGAALACMAVRGNIPIAAAMTFLSNPATTPLFLVGALQIGNRLGFHADLTTLQVLATTHASIGRWLSWLVSDAAPAMVTGLVLIAALSALTGYWVSLIGWRWWVGHKWRQRASGGDEAADAAAGS